jgi:hypothetical protein
VVTPHSALSHRAAAAAAAAASAFPWALSLSHCCRCFRCCCCHRRCCHRRCCHCHLHFAHSHLPTATFCLHVVHTYLLPTTTAHVGAVVCGSIVPCTASEVLLGTPALQLPSTKNGPTEITALSVVSGQIYLRFRRMDDVGVCVLLGRITWPPREISGEEAQAWSRFSWG